MEDNFPTFQWSRFLGGRDGDQVVVRGNDYEQFCLDVEKVKADFDNKATTSQPTQTGAKTSYTCEICGSAAELKQGVSKAGNPYKGIKCLVDDKHFKFLR